MIFEKSLLLWTLHASNNLHYFFFLSHHSFSPLQLELASLGSVCACCRILLQLDVWTMINVQRQNSRVFTLMICNYLRKHDTFQSQEITKNLKIINLPIRILYLYSSLNLTLMGIHLPVFLTCVFTTVSSHISLMQLEFCYGIISK